jgi:hypothetical protein
MSITTGWRRRAGSPVSPGHPLQGCLVEGEVGDDAFQLAVPRSSSFRRPGVVSLHAAVLVPPAVIGLLRDLEMSGHVAMSAPSTRSLSASRSFLITYSGVCLRCCILLCPTMVGKRTHSGGGSAGKGQVTRLSVSEVFVRVMRGHTTKENGYE